jgi:hypothetical protein
MSRERQCIECQRNIVPTQECAHDELGQRIGALKFQLRTDVKSNGFTGSMEMEDDKPW